MARTRWKEQFGYGSIYSIPENIQGVYGFWNRKTGRCLYVGKSRHVKNRLRQHWSDCKNISLRLWLDGFPKSIEICYWEVAGDKIRVTRVENRLIRRWRPESNIQGNLDN